MKSSVIFASYIPTTNELLVGIEMLDKMCQYFSDCDIFIGVNPSCPEWIGVIESYSDRLNIKYRITESDKVIKSDASAYQTALSLYKDTNTEHDLVWFMHTKGVTSDSTLRPSVYKVFHSKRTSIEYMFKENEQLGLFMPWMIRQLPKNKDYVENNLKHILVGDKFKRCSDLTGHYTFYTIKGSIIKNFLNDVVPEFFTENLLTLGVEHKFDIYFFERDFPMIIEKYNHTSYPNDHSWIQKYEHMTIDELAIKYNTDKSSKDHYYTQFYQKYFDKYLSSPKKILELGIYATVSPSLLETTGASLKTWAEYYPDCSIYGLDLMDFTVLDKNYNNIKTLACNCEIRNKEEIPEYFSKISDRLREVYTQMPEFTGGQIGLDSVIENFGSDYDVIIDDGPHTMSSQQIFMGYMFKHLKSGGIFVMEDLHTSNMGGQYNTPYTNKSTLWVLENYLKTGVIMSDFMTKEELDYINNNIKEVLIERATNSEIAFIIKK